MHLVRETKRHSHDDLGIDARLDRDYWLCYVGLAMDRPLSEKLSFVQTKIQELGLHINPQSRLAREARVFYDEQGAVRTVLPSDHRFTEALEALRDYTLFEFILDNWPFGQRDEEAIDKLDASLRDAVDPYVVARETRGRDTQLELYVAVALHRAGLPVELTTPDVRTRLNGRYFYVEAKRPKSQDGIENAIRGAARQIRDAGCPGAVFLDVSLAFNPTKGYVTKLMPDDQFRRGYSEGLRRGIHPVAGSVAKVIGNKPVSTICFQDHQLRQVAEGWKLESFCMTLQNPNPRLLKLSLLFERFLASAWPK